MKEEEVVRGDKKKNNYRKGRRDKENGKARDSQRKKKKGRIKENEWVRKLSGEIQINQPGKKIKSLMSSNFPEAPVLTQQ